MAAHSRGPRPLWLTVPLYALLLTVVVLDVRAAVFWARVGGSLGGPAALAAVAVALLAVALLVIDVRYQLLLGRTGNEPAEESSTRDGR